MAEQPQVDAKNAAASATEDGGEIEIKVLFFARAREIAGCSEMSIKMLPGSLAGDCLTKILTDFPKLEEIRDSVVVAINEEYAENSTLLKNKDELAIIPPISGG